MALEDLRAPEVVLAPGLEIPSLGGRFRYRILGPCCRLFDREELPWPCCRLSWRGKEPSWRRIGRRFVPDIAASRCPSYAVELIDYCKISGVEDRFNTVFTLYPFKLTKSLKDWWYSPAKPRS